MVPYTDGHVTVSNAHALPTGTKTISVPKMSYRAFDIKSNSDPKGDEVILVQIADGEGNPLPIGSVADEVKIKCRIRPNVVSNRNVPNALTTSIKAGRQVNIISTSTFKKVYDNDTPTQYHSVPVSITIPFLMDPEIHDDVYVDAVRQALARLCNEEDSVFRFLRRAARGMVIPEEVNA